MSVREKDIIFYLLAAVVLFGLLYVGIGHFTL